MTSRMNKEVGEKTSTNSAGLLRPPDLLAHLDFAMGETLSVRRTRNRTP